MAARLLRLWHGVGRREVCSRCGGHLARAQILADPFYFEGGVSGAVFRPLELCPVKLDEAPCLDIERVPGQQPVLLVFRLELQAIGTRGNAAFDLMVGVVYVDQDRGRAPDDDSGADDDAGNLATAGPNI